MTVVLRQVFNNVKMQMTKMPKDDVANGSVTDFVLH